MTPDSQFLGGAEGPSLRIGTTWLFVESCGRFVLGLTGPGLSHPLRGQSSSLSLFRSLDESSGPSLPSVLPKFIGTLATSDSLPGFVTALSGSPLIRFLPCEVSSAGPNRVSPVNLMDCLCVLPPNTPSRRCGVFLAVLRPVAGFALGTMARPGNSSS